MSRRLGLDEPSTQTASVTSTRAPASEANPPRAPASEANPPRAPASEANPPRAPVPDAEALSRMLALAERKLSREEFDAYVNAPMSEEEREHIASLIDWFCRRYPTPLDRLRAARRFYHRARARMPAPSPR